MNKTLLLLMATFIFGCQVLIGNVKIDTINGLTIRSTWKDFQDTCIVKLPLLKGKMGSRITGVPEVQGSMADRFEVGQKVEVKLRYTGHSGTVYEYTEFRGFVTGVSPSVPLVIECQDNSWLFGRTTLNKSWPDVSLRTIAGYLVDAVNRQHKTSLTLSGDIPTVDLDEYLIQNATAAQVVAQLKEKFGFVAYFKGSEFYIGLADRRVPGVQRYVLAGNCYGADLKWRRAEDRPTNLTAISILADNKKLKVMVPPQDLQGNKLTKVYANITDIGQLADIARADLKKMVYTGYEGSIKTKLLPFVEHSTIAELFDPYYEMREGRYVIDGVQTDFSTSSGVVRTVTLGILA